MRAPDGGARTRAAVRPALSQPEFIALCAMLTATVAFSIDGMLPALPQIAAELTPDAPNRAQLILTSFVLGMGLGTFFTGPLSDALGRKPVVVGGAAVYIAGAALAWAAPSLETMLAARVLQGLGAAGPRVVAMALIRDLYSGPRMAQILSFVLMVFSLVPALAPTLGAAIMALTGWRGIFAAFLVFSAVSVTWLALRQPETLPPERRRPLRAADLARALAEVWGHSTTRLSTLVQTLVFGMLFVTLSSTQQVFDVTFGRGEHFHLWFGGIALVAASASLLNARLVIRLGMRAIVRTMLAVQIAISALVALAFLADLPAGPAFALYVFWVTSLFFMTGLTVGNLNALALEPMGHVAGLAASVVASLSTVGSLVLAVPVGLMFDGTPVPMALAIAAYGVLAFALTLRIRRPGEVDTPAQSRT